MKIVQDAQQKDPVGFKDAAAKGPEALADYLNGSVSGQSASASNPDAPGQSATATDPGQEMDMEYNTESINESSDFDRMKQFLTRLNG